MQGNVTRSICIVDIYEFGQLMLAVNIFMNTK